MERDPETVAQDVIDGLVSREAAETIYGVVFAAEHDVDADGTREQRASLKLERQVAVSRVPALSEPPAAGADAVRHPLQESLDVCEVGGQSWVRCARCGHVLCESDRDWRGACSLGVAPPTQAGPLLDLLADRYEFQRWYCPGCSVLLESEIVTAES